MSKEPNRVDAGVPTGGQFAKTAHSENVPTLTSGLTTIPISADAVLNPAGYDPLPELPASVGTPEVSFCISDAGKVETEVKIGGSTVSFWTDDMDDDVANTIDNGNTIDGEIAPWSNIADMEDFQAARTWAEAVHKRVEGAHLSILDSATASREARKSIVAFATGHAEPAQDQTPQQSSAKRAAAAMALCDEGEGGDVTMRDLLTDLRHYADEHGIDIYQAMEESHGYYLHEKADPMFKEGF